MKKEPSATEVRSQNQPSRYHVEVLGKALDLLDILRASRAELRLTDLAERARLDLSTTFRLLYTMVERGYVRRD